MRKQRLVWVLQINDPGTDAHNLVVNASRDKETLQRLSARILTSNGLPAWRHKLSRKASFNGKLLEET